MVQHKDLKTNTTDDEVVLNSIQRSGEINNDWQN